MKTALLILDVQTSLVDDGAWNAEGTLRKIGELVARARNEGAPVLFVQDTRVEPDGSLHPGLDVRPEDGRIVKDFCDAFEGTSLQDRLRAEGVERLVVAGLQSDYCIDTTCRRAAQLGYQVLLASDAHTTYDHDHLTASQIVAHHNHILRNFVTGRGRVQARPAEAIPFR